MAKSYKIAVIPGDGTGPEVCVEAEKVLDDVNVNNDVAAINALQAFINAVTAQSGNQIPVEKADALIASAQAIIDLLTAL